MEDSIEGAQFLVTHALIDKLTSLLSLNKIILQSRAFLVFLPVTNL